MFLYWERLVCLFLVNILPHSFPRLLHSEVLNLGIILLHIESIYYYCEIFRCEIFRNNICFNQINIVSLPQISRIWRIHFNMEYLLTMSISQIESMS